MNLHTVFLLLAAGGCFIESINQLVLWLYNKKSKLYVSFFMTIFFVFLYYIAQILIFAFNQSGSWTQMFKTEMEILFSSSFIWFIFFYTKLKNNSIPMIFSTIYTVLFVIIFFEPLRDMGNIILFVLNNLLFIYSYYSVIQLYKSEKQIRSFLVLAISVICHLSFILDGPDNSQVTAQIEIKAFSFLLYIILMSFHISQKINSFKKDIKYYQKMEHSLLKFATAVEQSASTILITNTEGSIEYVNKAFETISGYSKEEALGNNPHILKSDKHPREFYDELWKTISSGQVWDGEFINKRKNGSLYWEKAIITPVKNDQNNIISYIAVKEDISKQKKLADFKQNIEQIMHHDLKAPLNAVIGFPQLLVKEDNLRDDQKEILRMIEESGHTMLNQIQNTLSLYKIEEGTYNAIKTPFDIIENIKRVIWEMEMTLHGKNITTSIMINHEPVLSKDTCMIISDPILFHIIITNILKNAFEAAPKKSAITVSIDPSRDGENVYIEIHNLGAVPREIQDSFFDKYSTHGKRNGTGLGTYSAKMMANVLDGDIFFTTHETEGTRITIILPNGKKK